MGRPILYPVNNEFFDEWSADMAYILGFTITDGCIYQRQNQISYGIKDKEILEFIRDKISPTRPIRYKFNPIDKYHATTRECYELKITINLEAMMRLKTLGVFAKKTGFEVCPDVPEKYFGDFLRGVFDGDGCLYYNKCNKAFIFTIICKNKQFLNDINSRINNIAHIYHYKAKDVYRLTICKQIDLRNIRNLLYSNNNFKLQRKYDIFQGIK
jgi:hypothetical protein